MKDDYEGNHLSINGRSEEEPHQMEEDNNSPRINHVVQMVQGMSGCHWNVPGNSPIVPNRSKSIHTVLGARP